MGVWRPSFLGDAGAEGADAAARPVPRAGVSDGRVAGGLAGGKLAEGGRGDGAGVEVEVRASGGQAARIADVGDGDAAEESGPQVGKPPDALDDASDRTVA